MAEHWEPIIALSDRDLKALAESKLSPANQARLNALLGENAEGKLSANDLAELDRLISWVDDLTELKALARSTLQRNSGADGA